MPVYYSAYGRILGIYVTTNDWIMSSILYDAVVTNMTSAYLHTKTQRERKREYNQYP